MLIKRSKNDPNYEPACQTVKLRVQKNAVTARSRMIRSARRYTKSTLRKTSASTVHLLEDHNIGKAYIKK